MIRGRAIAAAALVLLACTTKKTAPMPVDAAAPSPPPVVAPVDASIVEAAPPQPTTLETAAAWTDDVVVRKLAETCTWAPKEPKPSEWEMKISPLACTFRYEQFCAPDHCVWEEAGTCGPACDKACMGCGTKCATSCAACKKGCSDDDCRMACAKTCGECHDGCVKEADQCRTGKCVAQTAACHTRELAEFTDNGCAAGCDATWACFAKCMEEPKKGRADCEKPCDKVMAGGKCAKWSYGCESGWHPSPPGR